MDTKTFNHKRLEAVVYGEQRLYERLQGLRTFRLALFDGLTLPSVADFQPFEAYDYSRDGFSYWSPEKPATELLVIELRYRNRANYHEAKVVHLTQAQRQGVNWHLVGCRFSRRIELASREPAPETDSTQY